jgi:hypothetical protein
VATALPTDIDATFPDDGAAARKQHQQHHDAIHGYTNTHDAAPDPHPGYVLHTEGDATYLAKADNLLALTDKAAARENLGANAAYSPRAGASRRIGGAVFSPRDGSPVLSFALITPTWLLDATTAESVLAQADLPPWWQTYDVVLLWTNAGTGTGDVQWRYGHHAVAADGSVGTGATFAAAVTTPAGSQNVVRQSTLATAVPVSPALSSVAVQVARIANDAADTLPNDAGLVALILKRAS